MQALNDHAINAPYPNPIIDEWTAGLYSDKGWASYVLQKHFDEWMTEDDWKAIAAAGLNHVRIPVPYFMFAQAVGPNAPYLTLNRFAKLKEGVMLAKKYGLKVWIDLHSVPGSQNGFDNSGRAGPINWANNPSYYTQTQYAFNRLVTEFTQPAYAGVVTAIEAVNEPKVTLYPRSKTCLTSTTHGLVTRLLSPTDGTSTPTCFWPFTMHSRVCNTGKTSSPDVLVTVSYSTPTLTLFIRTGSTLLPTHNVFKKPVASLTRSSSLSSTTLPLQVNGVSTVPTETVLKTATSLWVPSSSLPVLTILTR